MFNTISIRAKNVEGIIGKSTVLMICEDALVKHDYMVTYGKDGHTLFAKKEDVLYP